MISRYDRGAQTLGDLGYEPFPDIARGRRTAADPARVGQRVGQTADEDDDSESAATARSPRPDRAALRSDPQ
jgi:hypothetical protein